MAHLRADDDVLSVASDRESLDIDRASLEADRESLYADSPMNEHASPASLPASTHPKSRDPDASSSSRVAEDSAQEGRHIVRDAGPAPPDYAAATADRRNYTPYYHSPEVETGNQSYGVLDDANDPSRANMFSREGLFGRNGLFSGPDTDRHPEDMSDPRPITAAPVYDEHTTLLIRRDDKRPHGRRWRQRAGHCCRFWVKAFIILVVIGIVAAVLSINLIKRNSNTPGNGRGKHPNDDGDFPGGVPPILDPDHPSSSFCRLDTVSHVERYEFDEISSFNLAEFLDDPYHIFSGSIFGSVWIQRAPSNQKSQIVVSLSYATPSPWRVTNMMDIKQKDSLEIKFPNIEPSKGADTSSPCLDLGVIVSIQANLTLAEFVIATAHLRVIASDTSLFEDGKFEVDKTDIATIARPLMLKDWSSRDTRLSTVSGSIKGRFALRDSLSISSTSGSITAEVDPKKADSKKTKPAVYTVDSDSGSVHTEFLTQSLPDRDYQTTVETKSSSVSGNYVFSSRAQFTSDSGQILATILPYAPDLYHDAKFLTSNVDGSTKVELLSPSPDHKTALSTLQSTHRSVSGSLHLIYPQQWEGHVTGDVVSGGLTFQGKDLVIDRDDSWGGTLRHAEGRKGHGDSRLKFKSISGSVYLRAGDL